MKRRIRMVLTSGAALMFFTYQAWAEIITHDIGLTAQRTLDGLGTKFVLAILIVSMAAIVCCKILRQR